MPNAPDARSSSRRIALALAVGAALLGWRGLVAAEGFAAQGLLGGERVETRVDSEIARRWLELGPALVSGVGLPAAEGDRIELANREPLSAELGRRLAAELSPDAATVYLVNRIAAEPPNRALRGRFDATLERLREELAGPSPRLAVPAGAIVVLVPGFGWRSDRTTGADFERQRRLLDRLGVPNRLIETVEDGAIDRNAELVARALEELARDHERLFLVSASKGGPEAALALTRAPAAALVRLEAWLSVGGLLRGSPYADRFTSGFSGFFARTVFAFKGLAPSSIADLSTAARRRAMESFVLPEGVRAIAWIGAPLSGQIRDDVRGRWQAILPHGPNDGLTLLVDQLVPGGRALVSPGLDHYFRDPEIDLKTAALTAVMFAESSETLDTVPKYGR